MLEKIAAGVRIPLYVVCLVISSSYLNYNNYSDDFLILSSWPLILSWPAPSAPVRVNNLAFRLGYSTHLTSLGVPSLSTITEESLSQFYQWFVGFSDAEASFWILPVLNSKNGIRKITWVFSIELHKDDKDVLEYIGKNLGFGITRSYKDKCIFTVTSLEGTNQLISIFDKYNLNTTTAPSGAGRPGLFKL